MTTLILLSLACQTPASNQDRDQVTDSQTFEEGGPGLDLASQLEVQSEHFATAGVCAECHENADGATAMRDSKGDPIGQYDLWQATMMANAARDPLFRAVVSAEVARNPGLQTEIEGTCLQCHSPMAHQEALFAGTSAPGLADNGAGEGDLAQLGLDGVSCTLCHQIQPDRGEPASFNAGYTIGEDAEMFGPHADPFTNPMEMHTGFTPTEGDHILDAGHCGSCHTLNTHTVVDGVFTETSFPEQTPFLEWQVSSFDEAGQTCQSCHMPTTDAYGVEIETRIARNPHGADFGQIDARSPFGRHIFRGGNAFMLSILRDNAEQLKPRASTQAFDAQIARERDFLGNQTAQLTLSAKPVEGDLNISVAVQNLAGHKLPSAHPSRRAWLEVVVLDDAGTVLFSSGTPNADGLLVDMTGTPLPSEAIGGEVHPHHDTLSADTQVQIYQSLMLDSAGEYTWDLLAAASYAKDNRILPQGWDATQAQELGVEAEGIGEDANFIAGSDQASYLLAGLADEATQVRVRLLYQTASPRYVAELARTETPEVLDFLKMYQAADKAPEVLAESVISL